jgi:hypothetical protein
MEGLPTKAQVLDWYHAIVPWTYSPKEITWGDAFGQYRGAIICQGIAARYAVRQASSAKAGDYGRMMGPYGEQAWESVKLFVRQAEEEGSGGRAKL